MNKPVNDLLRRLREALEGPALVEGAALRAAADAAKAAKAAEKPGARPKVIATSYERYSGGPAVKRLHGSSTVTRFYVYWETDKKDPSRWEKIEGKGASPAARKAAAIKEFLLRKEDEEEGGAPAGRSPHSPYVPGIRPEAFR